MDLSKLKKGDQVKVRQHFCAKKSYGPQIGEEGYVRLGLEEHTYAGAISVQFKRRSWLVWQCSGKESHHHLGQECSCIFDFPYSWRKL